MRPRRPSGALQPFFSLGLQRLAHRHVTGARQRRPEVGETATRRDQLSLCDQPVAGARPLRNRSKARHRATAGGDLQRLPGFDAFQVLARVLPQLSNPDRLSLHVAHGSTTALPSHAPVIIARAARAPVSASRAARPDRRPESGRARSGAITERPACASALYVSRYAIASGA